MWYQTHPQLRSLLHISQIIRAKAHLIFICKCLFHSTITQLVTRQHSYLLSMFLMVSSLTNLLCFLLLIQTTHMLWAHSFSMLELVFGWVWFLELLEYFQLHWLVSLLYLSLPQSLFGNQLIYAVQQKTILLVFS